MIKAKKGVYAASITPVNTGGTPDAARLVRYCRWLLDQGLDGVAPLGTTGEGNSLLMTFRLEVAAAFKEAKFRSEARAGILR